MIETLRFGLVAFRNVLLGGSAAAAPLITNPQELVRYSSESRFLLRAMNKKRGVRERSLAETLGRPGAEIDLRIAGDTLSWGAGVGSYVIDVLNIGVACRLVDARTYFQIGTFNGFTAYHAALNTADDAKIYTLDLPPAEADAPALHVTAMDRRTIRHSMANQGMVFAGSPVEPKITQLFGDSAAFDYSPYHGRIDVFFIDGAHSYEYVRSDTLNALDCCHEGSILLWHDFGRVGVNGVTRWLFELRDAGLPINVVPGGSLAYMVVSKDTTARVTKLR